MLLTLTFFVELPVESGLHRVPWALKYAPAVVSLGAGGTEDCIGTLGGNKRLEATTTDHVPVPVLAPPEPRGAMSTQPEMLSTQLMPQERCFLD